MAHWFVDTAGIGALIVAVVAVVVLVVYTGMVRWIARAPRDNEDTRGPLL